MKRICSLLLAVVILLSVFAGFEINAQAATSGDSVVAYARQYVGYSYVSGGSSPETGFDCSGFTMYIYGHFGVSLPHSSSMIYNNPSDYGTLIATDDYSKALPGDLICWTGHVGIYSGIYDYNGTYRGFLIDAANSRRGVVEQPIWESNGSYKVIRLKGIGNPVTTGEMSVPVVSLDKASYSVGDTVYVIWASTSANSDFKNYNVVITNTSTGKVIFSGAVGTEGNPYNTDYSFRIPTPGQYRIRVIAVPYNDAESRQKSASAYITVGNSIASIDGYITSGLNVSLADGWYFDSNGKVYYVASKQLKTGWFRYAGKWYCADEKGVLRTFWYLENGNWYFLGAGAMYTGWGLISGKWYYFNATGVMQTGWLKIKNVWYYFDENGVMQTEWQELSGVWYYLGEDGSMQTGWQKLDGKWYYFNSSGAMVKGWQKLDGKWYYFSSNGDMAKGWLLSNGKWYYLNGGGDMATGWKQLSGKWYYLSASGAMVTGMQTVSEKVYYFNADGVMQTGWQKINDVWYYFEESGAMKTGWLQIGSVWYYLNENGSMQTGWLDISGAKFYLNQNGSMVTGWKDIDGNRYYFNNNGVMRKGWLLLDGKWYYIDEDGAMLKDTTKTVKDVEYIFDENGVCTNP